MTMKFSEQWLHEWVKLNKCEHFSELITMLGFNSSYIVTQEINGILISCIRKIVFFKDTLKFCIVDDGKQLWQVICTSKVSVGQKIAFAKLGTLLPNDVKVFNKVFDGIESWGIFCNHSVSKLVSGFKNKSIILFPNDSPIGFDIGFLKTSIDIENLPNRSDFVNIKGISRELSAIYKLSCHYTINSLSVLNNKISSFSYFINVSSPKYCPKLCSRVIASINVNTHTPWWMYERLYICGFDSVNLIVDIINYVMLELGQPIISYDFNNIKGFLTVRMAKHYENITLVNGQLLKLKEDTLIFADDQGPLTIAGIIGSYRTQITNITKNILLLSAFFPPSIISGKANFYGVTTDFSYRYERGVDSNLQLLALERISYLLLCLAGCFCSSNIITLNFYSYLPPQRIIHLTLLHINFLLGYHIKPFVIDDILTILGFKIIKKNTSFNVWSVKIPSWRFDIFTQEDLIEELARFYGFNNFKTFHHKHLQLPSYFQRDSFFSHDIIYSQLISRGYYEVISYSFLSPKLHNFLQPNIYTPTINNPISKDFSVMRSSLWPGLLKSLIYNLNRQQTRIALFEFGFVFVGNNLANVNQIEKLGCIFTGDRLIGCCNHYKSDFFDVKGDIECLIRLCGDFNNWLFQPASHPALHSGKSSQILRKNKLVGWFGLLNPLISYSFGIPFEVFLFELELSSLLQINLPKVNNISRFPECTRDIAFLIPNDLSVYNVLTTIRTHSGKYLRQLILFDVYTDYYKGYTSVALRLTWHNPFRTLFDKELDDLLMNIFFSLKERYSIIFRT